MTTFLILVGIIGGLVLLFLVAILVVSLVETRDVFALSPVNAFPHAGPTLHPQTAGPIPLNYQPEHNYLTVATAHAAGLGYAHGGDFCVTRYPTTRVSLWLSPDRTTIAEISFGSMLKLPVKMTRLLSRLANGRVLITTDAPGLMDLTRMESRQVVMDGTFDVLHARHVAWLAAADEQGLVRPFEKAAHEEVQAIEVERAMRLEAFGYARFIDRQRGTHRFTLKGALMNSSIGLLSGVRDGSKGS